MRLGITVLWTGCPDLEVTVVNRRLHQQLRRSPRPESAALGNTMASLALGWVVGGGCQAGETIEIGGLKRAEYLSL